ncbi:MAG TPA: ROK family protein [Spirochaetota bacterium]|nr:ROK family protein [Spirochaetota bacterium]
MYRVGIDLGGTKIEGIILADNNKEIFRKRIPTEQQKGYQQIIRNIKTLYDEAAAYIKNQPHTLGVGTPGAVSKKTGLIKNSNTQCLNNKPMYKDLQKKLGRGFRLENDANCFALAEALEGAGKGYRMVFGIIMGTGCGGGIVYEGRVLNGPQSITGEWGHHTIDPEGNDCYCGKKGCVETYISGTGLENSYQRLTGCKKAASEIIKDFHKADPPAEQCMGLFFNRYGRSVANLITILDPDIVVIGGGLSNIRELYTIGRKYVEYNTFNDSLETPIVCNQLGDSAGVHGAADIGI